jgi:NitT/TauT family transport system substrate-binding protein
MGARPARSFLAAEVGIAFPSYGLIATDESLTKHVDRLRRLSANQTRAWTYIFESSSHLDEAVAALMAQRADKQLNAEVIKAQLALSKDFLSTPHTAGKPMGWQSDKDWKLAVKSMSDASLIKADAKIEDFFTNDFIKS